MYRARRHADTGNGARRFPGSVCQQTERGSSLMHISLQRLSGNQDNSHGYPQGEEKTMNRDQAKGRIEQASGKARETIGKVKGDKNLERKGKLQKDLGRARAVYGNTQEDIKNAKTSG
jgi:uncharacterized protein YjbJ (UPF0337 family)